MSTTTVPSSPVPERPFSLERVASAGRVLFGLGVIGFGTQQLLLGQFVRLVPALPASFPTPLLARAIGLLLLASGIAIVSKASLRMGAIVFGSLLAISFLLLQVPTVIGDPAHGYQWTNPCKALALIGGAILLATRNRAASNAEAHSDHRTARLGTLLCVLFFAGFMILAGVQHFVYADFVTQLVPAWMPVRAFWTYFTAVALLAGGVGTCFPRTRSLSAGLCGVMIFLWVILLHLPRAFLEANRASEWSGVFEATATSGVALLLAAHAAPLRSPLRRSPPA